MGSANARARVYVVFAKYTQRLPMTNDHHCSKLVKIDLFTKGVGRMPFRMLQVFQGILFEFEKTVRILSRILEVYVASCVLEYLRILSYTPCVPIRIRANSVANMCLFAQCLLTNKERRYKTKIKGTDKIKLLYRVEIVK